MDHRTTLSGRGSFGQDEEGESPQEPLRRGASRKAVEVPMSLLCHRWVPSRDGENSSPEVSDPRKIGFTFYLDFFFCLCPYVPVLVNLDSIPYGLSQCEPYSVLLLILTIFIFSSRSCFYLLPSSQMILYRSYGFSCFIFPYPLLFLRFGNVCHYVINVIKKILSE